MIATDDQIHEVIRRTLDEDLGERGDVTGQLIEEDCTATLAIVAREEGIVAGLRLVEAAFLVLDPTTEVRIHSRDGDRVEPGQCVAQVQGLARSILAAERTALNFLGHLSGIATLTARFVEVVEAANPRCMVLDTRKTTPTLRVFEKDAVVAGGGQNHRMGLYDAVLIKDNHLGMLSITEGVERARQLAPGLEVEVECDTVDQAVEAARSGCDAILLDNMDPTRVATAVAAIRAAEQAPVRIEVSGGVNLHTAGALAAAGPDCISVGALTHSAVVLDFGLDLDLQG